MNQRKDFLTGTNDREILLTRDFNAPREHVFEAWTVPRKIAKWWGPNGFTTTTIKMEFEEGGAWEFIMHGPYGNDYKNRIVYTEINNPKYLAYEHGTEKGNPASFVVTVTFEEMSGKTRLTMRMIFPTKEAREETLKFGAVDGGNQTLNRLAEYLSAN